MRDLKSIDKATRGDDEMSIFKFTDGEQIINARTSSACATFLSDYFFYNQTKCRDDREAYLSAQSYQETATDATGTYYYPRVKFRVWGYFRNGWCNWNAYSTQYEYRNLSETRLLLLCHASQEEVM